MAETSHIIIVVFLLIWIIAFVIIMFWLLSNNEGPFAVYVQPDPSSTDQWYRIHGAVVPKPTVGFPCEIETDCVTGNNLTCDGTVCLSIKGGICGSDDDCINPNTCSGGVCISP